jgi:hypothetical protein
MGSGLGCAMDAARGQHTLAMPSLPQAFNHAISFTAERPASSGARAEHTVAPARACCRAPSAGRAGAWRSCNESVNQPCVENP